MKCIVLNLWSCVCHFMSPDWTIAFRAQHPFWTEYTVNTLSGLTIVMVSYAAYLAARWFFRKTDVTVGYNWSFRGANWSPNFDIRNRSSSKTYTLSNIKYAKAGAPFWSDNGSLKGVELRPETMTDIRSENVAPVKNVGFRPPVAGSAFDPESAKKALEIEVTLRDQMGREFRAVGPGQQRHLGRLRTFLYAIHPVVKAVSSDSV